MPRSLCGAVRRGHSRVLGRCATRLTDEARRCLRSRGRPQNCAHPRHRSTTHYGSRGLRAIGETGAVRDHLGLGRPGNRFRTRKQRSPFSSLDAPDSAVRGPGANSASSFDHCVCAAPKAPANARCWRGRRDLASVNALEVAPGAEAGHVLVGVVAAMRAEAEVMRGAKTSVLARTDHDRRVRRQYEQIRRGRRGLPSAKRESRGASGAGTQNKTCSRPAVAQINGLPMPKVVKAKT
jgi:hypothetical protein